jgi:phosphoglycerol transferase MdoB-like AlkP superfamily enzyme
MTIRFSLWIQAVGALLGVQLVLGIWLNLYGTFPATSSVVRTLMYRGDPELSAHLAIAVILVVLAFVVAVSAFGPGTPPRLRWFTLGTFLAILGAYEAGILLIQSGFASQMDSLAMAAAFVVAVVFNVLAQLTLRRAPPPATAPVTTGTA